MHEQRLTVRACRRSRSPAGEQPQHLQQQPAVDHQDAAAACAWIIQGRQQLHQVQHQSYGSSSSSNEVIMLQASPCRLLPAPAAYSSNNLTMPAADDPAPDGLLMTATPMEQRQQVRTSHAIIIPVLLHSTCMHWLPLVLNNTHAHACMKLM